MLDLTNVLAGPFAGYQLGLMGADVVKVEVPGSGDLARNLGGDPELSARGLGISFLAQNSGKRSLTLDLKAPAGREVFERLVREADVLLVAHTGLDHMLTVGDVWRELPMDKRIIMRFWQVPHDEIPTGRDERIDWLFGWWERIDEWVAENRPEEIAHRK